MSLGKERTFPFLPADEVLEFLEPVYLLIIYSLGLFPWLIHLRGILFSSYWLIDHLHIKFRILSAALLMHYTIFSVHYSLMKGKEGKVMETFITLLTILLFFYSIIRSILYVPQQHFIIVTLIKLQSITTMHISWLLDMISPFLHQIFKPPCPCSFLRCWPCQTAPICLHWSRSHITAPLPPPLPRHRLGRRCIYPNCEHSYR